ncbi:hypothetical protein SBADM41S_03089 [Streptomyces badius]
MAGSLCALYGHGLPYAGGPGPSRAWCSAWLAGLAVALAAASLTGNAAVRAHRGRGAARRRPEGAVRRRPRSARPAHVILTFVSSAAALRPADASARSPATSPSPLARRRVRLAGRPRARPGPAASGPERRAAAQRPGRRRPARRVSPAAADRRPAAPRPPRPPPSTPHWQSPARRRPPRSAAVRRAARNDLVVPCRGRAFVAPRPASGRRTPQRLRAWAALTRRGAACRARARNRRRAPARIAAERAARRGRGSNAPPRRAPCGPRPRIPARRRSPSAPGLGCALAGYALPSPSASAAPTGPSSPPPPSTRPTSPSPWNRARPARPRQPPRRPRSSPPWLPVSPISDRSPSSVLPLLRLRRRGPHPRNYWLGSSRSPRWPCWSWSSAAPTRPGS